MTLQIRPGTLAEVSAIAELAAITFPHSAPPGSEPANIARHIARYLGSENFRHYLEDPACTLLLADDGGRAVGYSLTIAGQAEDPEVAQALSSTSIAEPGEWAELSKCYLHPERFGTGVASTLMGCTLDAAAASERRGIWLGVSSVNDRAIRFYQKHGFRKAGMKSFMFGDVRERDFVLARSLAGRMQ